MATIDSRHTYVFRAGISAAYLRQETTQLSFEVNIEKSTLDLRFKLGAAGGGETQVLICIGTGDLPFFVAGVEQLRMIELARLRKRVNELEAAAKIRLTPPPPPSPPPAG